MKLLPLFSEIESIDPETVPRVSLRNRLNRLDTSLREPLSKYLTECTSLTAGGNIPDPLDADRGLVVPVGFITDGEWAWSADWAYFVREYGVEVPQDFVDHARAAGFVPVELSDDEADRVSEDFERLYLET
jgi:hypothetical protein